MLASRPPGHPGYLMDIDSSASPSVAVSSCGCHGVVGLSCLDWRCSLISSGSILIETYYNLEQRMGEYNITKVVDGLFISDQNVAFDPAFLAGNKIIRLLGWTAEPFYHHLQEEGIEEHILSKNILEVKFPSFDQLEQGFRALQVIHEQMLCGLIYSESQLQASLICIMYLMRRYHWDHSTAYEFIRTKIEMFECSEQTLEELEKYQEELLTIHPQIHKLGSIQWDYHFLATYKPASDDEMLLITTIKNKMRGTKEETGIKNKSKKTRRIRWQDQMRPSSPFSFGPAKSQGRSSLLKNRLTSPTPSVPFANTTIQQEMANKDLELLYQSVNFKHSKVATREKKKDSEATLQENSQYMQLKQLSRTNFNDHKYMSTKVRRRTSLKPKTSHASSSSANMHNVSSLVGIYGGSKSSKGLSRAGSAQSFLTGLRSYNKLSINA